MKKLLLIFAVVLFAECSSEKRELYSRIDDILLRLPDSSGLYSAFGNDVEYTKDGYYRIMPISRMISIKIEGENATDDKYESLKNDLSKRYKNNPLVNKVYISNGGTVVLDCRK